MDKFITIGITGGIGSGKSYVCGIIEAMGYPVFYSDFEAKNTLVSNNELIKEIKLLFGSEAYINSNLNKSFIAKRIFQDPDLRSKMNQLVHPKVRNAFKDFCKQSNSELCFNEAAILFETGSYKNFNKNVLITAPIELKIARIKKRDQLSIDEIQNRINSQWPDDKKIPLADFVINNDEKKPLLAQIVSMIKTVE